VLLRVAFEHVPRVPVADSVTVEPIAPDFLRVTVRAGFMERPCVPDRLREAHGCAGMKLDAPERCWRSGCTWTCSGSFS
jgi:K+ transporter